MRIFGSVRELVRIFWREDGQEISLDANSSTTYTADRAVQLPPGDQDSILVGETNTQTLTNKTFTAPVLTDPTITIEDANLTIQDDGDNTKQLKFQASGITTGTTRTLTAPDANTTIVGTDATQTLTNKSIDADTNTITNIENADIKAGAAIDATKIADGSVTSTEFQFINTLTSNAQTQIDSKVTGPGSATDEAITRFDGTTGKLVQNSTVTVTDAGVVAGASISGASNTITNVSLTTGVTGTLPIGNGGTGQTTATAAFNALDPLTTKGDLISHNGTDSVRLAVGTDTFVLSANSATATGLEWVAASSSGLASADGNTAGTVKTFTPQVKLSVNVVSSADYTILDNDGYELILVSTANTNRTVTLPTAADNTGRVIYVQKSDTGTGQVIVDGEGAETIEGATTQTLYKQYEQMRLVCNGTSWIYELTSTFSYTPTTGSTTNVASITEGVAHVTRNKRRVTVFGTITSLDPTTAGSTAWQFSLPIASNLTAADDLAGTSVGQASTLFPSGTIQANTTNDTAQFNARFTADDGGQPHTYEYTYEIK